MSRKDYGTTRMTKRSRYALVSVFHSPRYYRSKKAMVDELMFEKEKGILLRVPHVKTKAGYWRRIPIPKEVRKVKKLE